MEDMVQEINAASSYSIICDETSDISTKEQLSICIRYPHKTNKDYVIKERFLGFIDVEDNTAETLFQSIKGYLQSIGIDIKKLRKCGARHMMERLT